MLLPDLKARKFRIYLESNGTLPQKLNRIINWLDIIAMDIKLPSSTGEKSFWNEHLGFLKVAKLKRVFIKIVITNKTKTEELDKAISLITTVGRNLPLVLQPVTPQKGIRAPDEKTLLEFKRKTRLSLAYVWIIPQLHKMWRID
jgi:organic radical activating enzyme